MEQPEVVTKPFTVTPSQYIGRVMGFWLSKWGWILLFPFFICGMLAFFRWEWLIVAFILLLIIYPFILVMLYFMYGLNQDGVRSVSPRQIQLMKDKLVVKYLRKNDDTDEFIPYEETEFNLSSLRSVTENDKGITIRLSGGFHKHIFIPDESLCDQRRKFTELLKESGTMFV